MADLNNLDLSFELGSNDAGSVAGGGVADGAEGAGGGGESRRPLRRRSFSGGVSAAGEPASSTAAGRQSRVESSAGGTSSNRGPLSRPRRPVARSNPATRRSDRVQQDPRAPDPTGPGLQHAPSRTNQDVGAATGSTPSGWTEYVDDLVFRSVSSVYTRMDHSVADRASRGPRDGTP